MMSRREIEKKVKAVINKNYTKIIYKVDPGPLITVLRESKLLTVAGNEVYYEELKNKIEVGKTKSAVMERLIDILFHRENWWIPLIKALRQCEQDDIADIIEKALPKFEQAKLYETPRRPTRHHRPSRQREMMLSQNEDTDSDLDSIRNGRRNIHRETNRPYRPHTPEEEYPPVPRGGYPVEPVLSESSLPFHVDVDPSIQTHPNWVHPSQNRQHASMQEILYDRHQFVDRDSWHSTSTIPHSHSTQPVANLPGNVIPPQNREQIPPCVGGQGSFERTTGESIAGPTAVMRHTLAGSADQSSGFHSVPPAGREAVTVSGSQNSSQTQADVLRTGDPLAITDENKPFGSQGSSQSQADVDHHSAVTLHDHENNFQDRPETSAETSKATETDSNQPLTLTTLIPQLPAKVVNYLKEMDDGSWENFAGELSSKILVNDIRKIDKGKGSKTSHIINLFCEREGHHANLGKIMVALKAIKRKDILDEIKKNTGLTLGEEDKDEAAFSCEAQADLDFQPPSIEPAPLIKKEVLTEPESCVGDPDRIKESGKSLETDGEDKSVVEDESTKTDSTSGGSVPNSCDAKPNSCDAKSNSCDAKPEIPLGDQIVSLQYDEEEKIKKSGKENQLSDSETQTPKRQASSDRNEQSEGTSPESCVSDENNLQTFPSPERKPCDTKELNIPAESENYNTEREAKVISMGPRIPFSKVKKICITAPVRQKTDPIAQPRPRIPTVIPAFPSTSVNTGMFSSGFPAMQLSQFQRQPSPQVIFIPVTQNQQSAGNLPYFRMLQEGSQVSFVNMPHPSAQTFNSSGQDSPITSSASFCPPQPSSQTFVKQLPNTFVKQQSNSFVKQQPNTGKSQEANPNRNETVGSQRLDVSSPNRASLRANDPQVPEITPDLIETSAGSLILGSTSLPESMRNDLRHIEEPTHIISSSLPSVPPAIHEELAKIVLEGTMKQRVPPYLQKTPGIQTGDENISKNDDEGDGDDEDEDYEDDDEDDDDDEGDDEDDNDEGSEDNDNEKNDSEDVELREEENMVDQSWSQNNEETTQPNNNPEEAMEGSVTKSLQSETAFCGASVQNPASSLGEVMTEESQPSREDYFPTAPTLSPFTSAESEDGSSGASKGLAAPPSDGTGTGTTRMPQAASAPELAVAGNVSNTSGSIRSWKTVVKSVVTIAEHLNIGTNHSIFKKWHSN